MIAAQSHHYSQIMQIRSATSLDRNDIRSIHLSAFGEGEREVVSKLAVDLLSENTTPQIISLVAEIEGAVVGHVAWSPVTTDRNENWLGYILAPVGVKPNYQNQRIGSKLIDSGVQQLLKMGVNIVFVYGDPKYYSRFGFRADLAVRYTPPYTLQYPFGWQAIILNESNISQSSIKITCVQPLCDPQLW